MLTTGLGEYTPNTTRLAELLGVRPQRIAVFVHAGMPKLTRGKYDARECIRWLLRRASGAKVPTGIQEARRLLYEAQTEHKRLETRQLAATLVEVEEAWPVIATLADIYISAVDGLAPRLAQVVAEFDDPAIIEGRLDDELREVLESVSHQVEEFGRRYQAEVEARDDNTAGERHDAEKCP